MKHYLRIVANALEKYKVPTKLIQEQVHLLSDQLQIILSNIEQVDGHNKAQKARILQVKKAMREAATIMHKIQNLAAIEIHPPGQQ